MILFLIFSKYLIPNYQALKFLTSLENRQVSFLTPAENQRLKSFSPSLLEKVKALNFPRPIPKLANGYRIVFTASGDMVGELNVIYRIGQLAEKLGYEYAIINNANLHQKAIEIINPDFIVSLSSTVPPTKSFINFLYFHSFLSQYFDENGNFYKDSYAHLLDYDGFLNLLPNLDTIENYFKENNKPFYFTTTYFSLPANSFSNNTKNRLCYWGGGLWDKERGSTKYLDLYSALDNTDYYVLYGPEITWKDKNYKSYKGMMPIGTDDLINAVKDAGIALILHSHEHLKEGVPTARIFEALSSSAVIISDHHPFVVEHFGDNVLYIDQNASAEEMFKQIDSHVNWIIANPQAAMEKAKACHDIFISKFSLEKELQKIIDLYEFIKANQ